MMIPKPVLFGIVALLFLGAWGYFSTQEHAVDGVQPITPNETKNENSGEDDLVTDAKIEESEKRAEEETSVVDMVVLDLHDKKLTKVPEYVFQKTDTQKLDVSNNLLEGSLQAEIRHLVNLEELDLSYNTFTGVPAEIGQLQKLKVLNLSHNNLTGLPYELGNLKNLSILDLRGNTCSPADVERIKSLLPATTKILL